MSNPTNPQQLLPLIKQGVELLHELEQLLTRERSALEQRDLEAIQQSSADKSALLPEIQANFNARHELLGALGVTLSAEGWQYYLSTLPQDAAELLGAEWQTLSDALERTQTLGLINQQLVAHGQENTARLLNLLQGKSQTNQLYGSSGRNNNFSTQSRLGKA